MPLVIGAVLVFGAFYLPAMLAAMVQTVIASMVWKVMVQSFIWFLGFLFVTTMIVMMFEALAS